MSYQKLLAEENGDNVFLMKHSRVHSHSSGQEYTIHESQAKFSLARAECD